MLPRHLQIELFLLALLVFASFGCSDPTNFSSNSSPHSRPNHAININTADVSMLESLPNIGHALALKIVEHRSRYGPFRKPEHLLILDGMSEKKFLGIQSRITVD
jgi:competence protein ComEA